MMSRIYVLDLAEFLERQAAKQGDGINLSPSDAEAAARALRFYSEHRRHSLRERLADRLVALADRLRPATELRSDSI